MNKYTGRLLKIASIALLCSQNCLAEPTFTNDTIRNYVENAIEQLLGVNNEYDPLAREDISIIKERVIAASLKPTVWERMFRRPIERTSDEIQKNVYTGIIDFVEEQSYKAAFDKTNNAYIATKVSQNLRNFVANRVAETGEFKAGRLARFAGCRLRDAILEQCSRFSAVHDATSLRIVKCRVCFEKFVESECIRLSTCGHVVCKKCAHEQFFERNGTSRCPRCTKPVDINDLREKLYGTSAPTDEQP